MTPQFWTGDTGRRIKALCEDVDMRDVQRVALYLMTAPNSNMIGLYYLPLPTLVHEVGGLSIEGATQVLRSLEALGFLRYDDAEEVVWVLEMARFQIEEALSPKDKRVSGVMNELHRYRNSRFVADFYARYKGPFSLPDVEWIEPARKPHRRPSVAPPKPGAGAGAGAGHSPAASPPESVNGHQTSEIVAHGDLFDRFYELYPRKVGLDDARRKWNTVTKKTPPAEILAGLERQLPELSARQRKYIPHPATWLNQGRWKDEVATATNGTGRMSRPEAPCGIDLH